MRRCAQRHAPHVVMPNKKKKTGIGAKRKGTAHARRVPLAAIDANTVAAEARSDGESAGCQDLTAAEPDNAPMFASLDECVAACFHQWARTGTKAWLRVLLFDVADEAAELQSEMEGHFIRYAAMASACKQKVLEMGGISACTHGSNAAQDIYFRTCEEAHRELESVCCATTETCCTWSISPYQCYHPCPFFQVQM